MYATPSDMIAWFDAQEISQLATPKRYPVVDAVLLELTASGGDRSSYPPADIEAADAALAVINDALIAATNLIDSYLTNRYTVPLAQAQIDTSPLPRICGDVARYELSDDKAIDTIKQRYDNALRWLRDVAAGNATLGAGDPAPVGGGAVVVNGPGRIFSRNTMKGL